MPDTSNMSVYELPYGGLRNIQGFVKNELINRESNRGLGVPTSVAPYKGPLTSWIRACSNGSYSADGITTKSGFIMNGVNGFNDTYGFNTSTAGSSILGYTADGKTAHIIDSNNLILKNRPSPGIIGIEVTLTDQWYRQVQMKWVCWSKDQLDYMEKYFMIPGLSIVLEWGWNTFNKDSLLDLTNIGRSIDINPSNITGTPPTIVSRGKGLMGIFSDDDYLNANISQSNGNYDCIFGKISGFETSQNDAGGYEVTTTIVTPSGLYSGMSARYSMVKDNNSAVVGITDAFTKYLDNILTLNHSGSLESGHSYRYGKEDRYFIGDDTSGYQFNWDKGRQNEYYITMGLFFDILNKYITVINEKNNCSLFKFDISQSWIKAHPNIKSVNGDVLLIPNPNAPQWGSPLAHTEGSDSFISSGTLFDVPNALMQTYLGTTYRIDLQKIITKNLKNNTNSEFPNFSEEKQGNTGLLSNLFVRKQFIENIVASADTIDDILTNVFAGIMDAGNGIWDFEIKPVSRVGVNDLLTVVDKNFLGFDTTDINSWRKDTYTFKVNSADSIILDFSFNIKSSDSITFQTLFSENPLSSGSIINNPIPTIVQRIVNDRVFSTSPGSVRFETAQQKQEKSLDVKKTAMEADKDYYVVKEGVSYFPMVEKDRNIMSGLTGKLDSFISQNNGIMPGIELEITILGISGLRQLDYCFIDGLPDRYSLGCLFQITNISHSIQDGKWTTKITAGVRPIEKWFQQNVGFGYFLNSTGG